MKLSYSVRRKYYDLLVTLWNLKYSISRCWEFTIGSLFREDYLLGSWKSNFHFHILPKLYNFIYFITPWFNNAREFLDYMHYGNSSKPLDTGLTFVYLRDRHECVKYYQVTNIFGLVVVIERQWISSKTNQAVNIFLEGFIQAFNDEETPEYKEIKEVIFNRPIFTKKQLIKAKQDIQDITENLGW